MKRTLMFLLCFLLVACPLTLMAYADESAYLSDTIIDESCVKEAIGTLIADDPAPLSEYIEDEADLYGTQSFDDENAAQLIGARVLDQILVKFKDPVQVPGKEKQLQHEIEKFEKIGFVEGLGVYVVRIGELEKNPNAVLNRLKNNKYIKYVEPNYSVECGYTPNDPAYVNQRAIFDIINALAGWDITKGEGSPIIAVIDTGVIATHPDMPKLLGGYAAVSGLSPNNDTVKHGTSVAGVIGAIGDNKVGVSGINWNARIMSVKVDDASGAMTTASVAKGIMWAADNGAKIINLSLGQTTDSTTLKSAIDYAYNKGCAIFAATGNNSTNSIHYPARYSNVMAVGSTLSNGTARTSTSNYGTGIDIVAVGVTYYTTAATGGYGSATGTSFASPQAAGLASLIWALNPSLTNAQVYDLIRQNTKPLGGGFNLETGYGLIDIGKTLAAVAGTGPGPVVTPPPPPKPNPTITLHGFAEVTYAAGATYKEDGYTARDCDGKDITGRVTTSNNIDKWVAGLYTVSYTVTDDYGGMAAATRTVRIVPAPDPPPPEIPTITANGSGVIILHLGGTPYMEQGARAIDYDGENISNTVEIIGEPDTARAGTYSVTYRVAGKSGEAATATRTIRVIAPSENMGRKPYSFSSQAKQGAVITHTNIVAGQSGWMDLKVTSLDKNMTIVVELIDSASKSVLIKDAFSAAGMKQYQVDDSRYELKVTIDKANGNSKYDISLLMPEISTVSFAEEEVPLADWEATIAPIPQTGDAGLPVHILVLLGLSLLGMVVILRLVKRKRA